MAFELVGVSGPVEGERFALDTEAEVILGRTQKGINIPDPLVSKQHCKVVFGREWRVVDLESATGTRVNGKPIPVGKRVAIDVGDVIGIGESELRLESAAFRMVRRLLWGMIPAWVLVVAAIGVLFWASGEGPVTLTMGTPVQTDSGPTSVLEVPKSFLRTHGLAPTEIMLNRVTDFDGDKVDELWLAARDRQYLITFVEGEWSLLASLPDRCVDRRADGFPTLDCDGVQFEWFDGGYVPITQANPVVWFVGDAKGSMESDEEAPAAADGTPGGPLMKSIPELDPIGEVGGPVPYRMGTGRVDQVSGFLMARGIDEPVHYVICEDVFPGMPAQALLQSGQVLALSPGCEGDLAVEGPIAPAFEGSRAGIVALSAVGALELGEHLTRAWSGTASPLFLDEERRRVLQAVNRAPVRLQTAWLTFGLAESSSRPFPNVATAPRDVRLITEVAATPGITATLLSPGNVTMDPEGCSEIVVRTGSFRCATMRACLPWATFAEVVETGCGAEQTVVSVGYSGGIVRGATENIEVVVETQVDPGSAISDVTQLRVGVRPISP